LNLIRAGVPIGRRNLEASSLGARVVFDVRTWDAASPGVKVLSAGGWPSGLVVSVEVSDDGGATFVAPDTGAVTFTASVAKAAIDVRMKTHLAFRVSTVGTAAVVMPILRGVSES